MSNSGCCGRCVPSNGAAVLTFNSCVKVLSPRRILQGAKRMQVTVLAVVIAAIAMNGARCLLILHVLNDPSQSLLL